MVTELNMGSIVLYSHTAWADDPDGTGFSLTEYEGALYCGNYADTSDTDSTDPSRYEWSITENPEDETTPDTTYDDLMSDVLAGLDDVSGDIENVNANIVGTQGTSDLGLGNVNELIGTNKGTDGWTASGGIELTAQNEKVYADTDDGIDILTVTCQSAGNNHIMFRAEELRKKLGEDTPDNAYTLSCDFRMSELFNIPVIAVRNADGTGMQLQFDAYEGVSEEDLDEVDLSGTWIHHTSTASVIGDGEDPVEASSQGVFFDLSEMPAGAVLGIANLKIEGGGLATPWRESLSEIRAKADRALSTAEEAKADAIAAHTAAQNAAIDAASAAQSASNAAVSAGNAETSANAAQGSAQTAASAATSAQASSAQSAQSAQQAQADAETARTAAETATQAVDALTDEVDALEAQVASAEGNIAAIEGNITTLQGAVSTAQGNITAIQGNISALQSEVGTAQSNIQNLNGRIAAAEGSITTAENDISSLSGRVADAENDIDATLEGLAIAQNVVGTLNWITAHSTVTTDTTPVTGKTYYIKNQDNTFSPVTDTTGKNPALEGWYEMDEAISNYVASHLALTNDGLFVTADDSPWKVQIADDGVYIIDSTSGLNRIVAKYSDDLQLGKNEDAHLSVDFHSMQMVDSEGRVFMHVSDLRNDDGYATFNYGFVSDGERTYYQFYFWPWTIKSVKVNGQELSRDYYTYSYGTEFKGEFQFYGGYVPPKGATVNIEYTNRRTDALWTKAYTFGQRKQNQNSVGPLSIAEGYDVTASGEISHAEGLKTNALGEGSHAEGSGTSASGWFSHSEGNYTRAEGYSSHAEGENTTAAGGGSHSEGSFANASGDSSHAEGRDTAALGQGSHAGGGGTIAGGPFEYAIGKYNLPSLYQEKYLFGEIWMNGDTKDFTFDFSDGTTYYPDKPFKVTAELSATHQQLQDVIIDAYVTVANDIATVHVTNDTGTDIEYESWLYPGSWHLHITIAQELKPFTIGNGEGYVSDDDLDRSNAFTVDWDGNTWCAGDFENGTGDKLSDKADSADLAAVATSGEYSDLSNAPNLAAVATSGEYSDLSNAPNLAAVATSGSYDDLSDKPVIPVVNDAVLDIKKNGKSVGTFSANASSNVSADIIVPTVVSDLVNDAGFITSASLPTKVSDLTNDSGFLNAAGIIDLLYPVNSCYVTGTNTNPASILGRGTWTLIDKSFKYSWITSGFSFNTSVTTNGAFAAITHGHTVEFRLTWKNKVALSDSTTTIGTLTRSSVGLSAGHVVYPVGYCDGCNAVGLFTINLAEERSVLSSYDWVTKATSYPSTTGESCDLSFVFVTQDISSMADGFCDHFVWKRTA